MRFLFSVLMSVLLVTPAVTSAKPLLIATGEFPPYTSSKIRHGGFLVQITMRALELGEIEADEIYLPWARGYMGVQKLHFDATFPYLKTKEREAIFLYSDPLFPMAVSVFVRKGEAHLYSRPEDFIGRSWCLPRAYAADDLQPYLKQGLMSLVRASDEQACMGMVKRNRVTAYPMDLLVGRDLLKQKSSLFEGVVNLSWAVNKRDYFLLVSKSHPRGPEIIAAFNSGLRMLKGSPEWQEILKHYDIDEQYVRKVKQATVINLD